LFLIYWFFKKKYSNKFRIAIPENMSGIFLSIILMQIAGAVVFGVGMMGKEIPDTGGINFIFKVFNRFDVTYGIFIYLLVPGKKKGEGIILILMLCLRSFIRLSLGLFLMLGFFLIIKYYDKIIKFIKKYLVLLILFTVFIFPNMVSFLLIWRNSERSGKQVLSINQMQAVDLLFGKLIGRISSFTNSAVIIQNEKEIKSLTRDFHPFLFAEEMFTLSTREFRRRHFVNYSYLFDMSRGYFQRGRAPMLGTQGILLVGLYQSVFVFLVNLLVMAAPVLIMFYFASFFHYKNIYEIIFMAMCSSVNSGSFKFEADRIMFCMVLFLFVVFLERYMIPFRIFFGTNKTLRKN
jgi:hypothetical protein